MLSNSKKSYPQPTFSSFSHSIPVIWQWNSSKVRPTEPRAINEHLCVNFVTHHIDVQKNGAALKKVSGIHVNRWRKY